jgi:hypothetical protein
MPRDMPTGAAEAPWQSRLCRATRLSKGGIASEAAGISLFEPTARGGGPGRRDA